MKYLCNSVYIILLLGIVSDGPANAQRQPDTIFRHTLSTDIAQNFLGNALNLSYENRIAPRWSYYTTVSLLYSTPGHTLYEEQEDILYCGTGYAKKMSFVGSPRIDKGGKMRIGGNYHLLNSTFLLSAEALYTHSYYRHKLVSYGGCPPNMDKEITSFSQRDHYYLLIESSQRNIIQGNLIGRLRLTFWERLLTELWAGIGLQHRFENRVVHDQVSGDYYVNLLEFDYCKKIGGCPSQVKWNHSFVDVVAGLKVGYLFNVKR